MRVPPPEPDLELAVATLRAGGLVGFPTETVYGLGADARRSEAVRRIFAAKGRPATNPLIVHVADAGIARRYVTQWPVAAGKLAEAFWPGPLTLVLPKSDEVAPEVTGGLSTVGIRVPDHPLALALLERFDGPVAAPSANRANRVSPTTAAHVREELGNAVDVILVGGPCEVGIESTVLALTSDVPTILRPGGVSREQIERVVGAVRSAAGKSVEAEAAPSPGMGSVHYAPKAPAYRFGSGELPAVRNWLSQPRRGPVTALLMGGTSTAGEIEKAAGDVRIVWMPATPEEYARRLYSALREADIPGAGGILVQIPPDGGEWVAIHDRLNRATRSLLM
jgi:L-threonylcarbamoyladenylate synthase